jgi:hypothetical protein
VIELAEHQFEILPDEASIAGVGFGIGLDVSVNGDGFDPGETEALVQDSVNSTRGSTMFGRDELLGPTWTWAAHVDQTDVITALAAQGELKKAWRADAVRQRPGATSVIRYRIGDRVRRVYGRPRRWAAPPDNKILSGFIPVTMTFKTADDLHYADTETATDIGFVAESAGGFIFPTTFPATALPAGQRDGLITVGGDVATYPIIRFNGPVTNPRLACDNSWSVQLDMSIADGQYVEIDTRPWKLTVLRLNAYSEAGKLGKRTRMKDMVLTPGNHDLAFTGNSAEGTASCIVRWRDAYASL